MTALIWFTGSVIVIVGVLLIVDWGLSRLKLPPGYEYVVGFRGDFEREFVCVRETSTSLETRCLLTRVYGLEGAARQARNDLFARIKEDRARERAFKKMTEANQRGAR